MKVIYAKHCSFFFSNTAPPPAPGGRGFQSIRQYTHWLNCLGFLLTIFGWVLGHCLVLLLSLCRTVEPLTLRMYGSVKANNNDDDDDDDDDAAAKESMRCFILLK